ncbi:hypothetical protein [Streptococcus oralis]|jgi:hypothetical protein|uniref:MOLONEY MURINE LEUKEMIA VIRUS CAPSID MURINE LEUKEMIA VIRUS CAPSID n=1 Tax=Siphoviridae sp. ctLAG1 TaxID=2826248 RepID=A0A8S5MGX4_9CAUD|nr:hypothetical protein [Streptococcus oralis]MCY7099012.1 hypothetical protein [Streptococcus oralis]DAD81163.1 MAG TPA: MOLONEY MURINE LEUKEMIA VIRUS CAPSID MURINE LEUKEMIA VIRUS CAPSID [Siphoviridae sp. ctLAG1]
MEFTQNEIVKQHKVIRLVQQKNESWEEFKERIQATIEKLGDNYLTQTQPVREIKNKGTRNVRRTYVNILLKEVI